MEVRRQLEAIAAGERDTLIVPRLRDAAGSRRELLALLDWLSGRGARLVAREPPFDSGDPAALALAREIAGWEPDRPPGRPGLRHADPALAARIEALRRAGLSLQAIADRLNGDGVPTPRGGRSWRPSSVQAALGYRRPGPPPPGAPARGARAQRQPGPPGPPGPPRPPGRRP